MKYEEIKNLFRKNAMGRKFRPEVVAVIDVADVPSCYLACGAGNTTYAKVDLAKVAEKIKAATEANGLYVFGRESCVELDLRDYLLPVAEENWVSRVHGFFRRKMISDLKGTREVYMLFSCCHPHLWAVVQEKTAE